MQSDMTNKSQSHPYQMKTNYGSKYVLNHYNNQHSNRNNSDLPYTAESPGYSPEQHDRFINSVKKQSTLMRKLQKYKQDDEIDHYFDPEATGNTQFNGTNRKTGFKLFNFENEDSRGNDSPRNNSNILHRDQHLMKGTNRTRDGFGSVSGF